MSLSDPTSDCDPVNDPAKCDECVAQQLQGLQSVLVGLVQAIQAGIVAQGKSIGKVTNALTKIANKDCCKQSEGIDPAFQALLSYLSNRVTEDGIRITLMQSLLTQIQQTLVSQQSTITQIQNVTQTTIGAPAGGIGVVSPPNVPIAPSAPIGVILGGVPVPSGPNITVSVAPVVNIPPSPPVTVILPPSTTNVAVNTVLPSITNAISNVTQIGPITATANAQGGGVTVNPQTIIDRVEKITNNFREVINTWKLPYEGAKPPGLPPRVEPPTKPAGLHAVDPIAFPVTWAIAPDDDDWRDKSSQWAGDVLQIVQYAPSFDDLVQFLKQQVSYLGA